MVELKMQIFVLAYMIGDTLTSFFAIASLLLPVIASLLLPVIASRRRGNLRKIKL